MNKHTPGPWQLARFNPERATVEVETVARGDELPDQGCFIALVGAYGAGIEDAPEARLIAAAPDLLAALEAVPPHKRRVGRRAGRKSARAGTRRGLFGHRPLRHRQSPRGMLGPIAAALMMAFLCWRWRQR
jgi:hypothetical protein